jgi:hypothetical protein
MARTTSRRSGLICLDVLQRRMVAFAYPKTHVALFGAFGPRSRVCEHLDDCLSPLLAGVCGVCADGHLPSVVVSGSGSVLIEHATNEYAP